MNKINFVNNSEPALSAKNLNQMQNNMEEAGVIVSPTEPTTNEKVWIQKGKNLFNSNLIIRLANCTNNNGTIKQNEADTNSNLNWKIQTSKDCVFISNPMTLAKNDIGKISLTFIKLSTFNEVAIGLNGSKIDTLVVLNASKLIDGETYTISFEITNVTQGSISWKNIQIEQNTEATEYEEYIEKKIYCKNDNGEFEEFVNAETMGIETITNENGTAIKFPDGTLICKGMVSVPANNDGIEKQFPVPFVTENVNTIQVCLTNIYAYSRSIMWSGQAKSLTTLGAYPFDVTSNATPTVESRANYTAIGRWK